MIRIFCSICVCLVLLSAPAAAIADDFDISARDYAVVINLAGKQRMLTQKMSKEMMLIALGVEKDHNLKELKNTAELFDKTLEGLRKGDRDLRLTYTTSRTIIKQLARVGSYWRNFHEIIVKVVGSKRVKQPQIAVIAKRNLPLLWQMDKCVKMFEQDAQTVGLDSNPGLAVRINLAGRQRMLTQKMAKEYLLIALDHDAEKNRKNLGRTAKLFERMLTVLEYGDYVLNLSGTENPQILEQLSLIARLWTPYRKLIDQAISPDTRSRLLKSKIESLAEINLLVLREMDKAVLMYEREAAKLR